MRASLAAGSLFALFIVPGCGSSSDGPVGSTSAAAGSVGHAAGAGGATAGQGGASAGAGGLTAGQGGASAGKAGAAGASGSGAAGKAGASGGGAAGKAGKAGASGGGAAGTPAAGGAAGAGAGGASGASGASGGPVAGAAGASGSSAAPPPSATAPTVTGVPTVVLAADQVTFPLEAVDAFLHADNLDGMKFSNPTDPSHCKLRPGGKAKDVVIDGPNGEDNSFGKNVMPILLGLNPDFNSSAAEGIASGKATIVARARNLGPGEAYNGVSVDLLGALGDGTKPSSFDGYKWRPVASQLSTSVGLGDALVASGPSTQAYTVGNVLVARGMSGVVFPTVLIDSIADGPLAIERAGLIAQLSADHRAITSGMVTGLVPTQSLSDAIQRWAAKISPSLCGGATIENVIMQIEGASDQLLTGAQDASRTCDAISIGFGVRARASAVGSSSVLVATNPCD